MYFDHNIYKKIVVAAGLRPDPLWNLSTTPDSLATMYGQGRECPFRQPSHSYGRFAAGRRLEGWGNGKGFLEEGENIYSKPSLPAFIFSSKCINNRLVARLCPDPLGEPIRAFP